MRKQKRNVLLAMSISMSLLAGMALAACGGGETHALSLHRAKEATCTEAGNVEYYSCSDCGKLFSDAEGKNEVTLDEVTIAALGHKTVAVEAKEATCTEDGCIAHYECENGCGMYFSDAEGENVIAADEVVLPKLEHKNMQEVTADIDEAQGRGWLDHFYCPDCKKYFADIFGDNELSEDEVFFEKIDSVTITLTGKNRGEDVSIAAGDAALTGVDYDITASGTVSAGASSSTLTLTDVYPIAYTVSYANGEFMGSITFEEGETEYSLELAYQWAKDTSYTREGTAHTAVVDLSQIGASDPVIIMSDTSASTGYDGYAHASLVLSDDVKESDMTAVTFTVRWLSDVTSGGTTVSAHARFGVRMAGDDGIGVYFIGWGGDNKEFRIGALQEEGYYNEDSHAGGIFDATGLTSFDQYYDAATAAIYGDGMQVAVVRADTSIDLYLNLNGEWLLMASTSCEQDAETAISFVVGGHEWEFSDIEYGNLEWVEEQPATETQYGIAAHYAFGELKFNADGALASDEDLSILPTGSHDEVTLSVLGKENGETAALGGTIELTWSDGETKVSGTVTNGEVTLEDVKYGDYTISATAGDKTYVGTLFVSPEIADYDLTLIYEWAKDTSIGGTAEVDLSKMSDANHTITMCERYGTPDIWTGNTGVSNWAEATLLLPDAVKNSSFATVEFTLKLNADATIHALTRFGVMMAERKGICAAVMGSGSMQVFNINPDNENGIFDGWSGDHNGYADAVIAALQGAGLQVRVVRDGTEITMYMYLNNAWTEMASTTVAYDSATDIRLVVGGNNTNVWEFSSIEYYGDVPEHEHVLTLVPEQAATCTADGHIAYYTCSQCNKLFADADGTQLLAPDKLATDMLGHETLQYVAQQDSTVDAAGYEAHYKCPRCGALFLDEEGKQPVTLEEITIQPLHESISISGVQGRKDGANAALSGTIKLTNNKNSAEGTLTDGAATLAEVAWGTYSVEVTTASGEVYDGTIEIGVETTYTLSTVLQYRFVTITETIVAAGGTYTVDLSKINDADHTLTINANGPGNTKYYTKAGYTISEELANSKYVVMDFMLNYTGEYNALTRFGVMMTNDDGVAVMVNPNGDEWMWLCTYPFYELDRKHGNNNDGLFGGDSGNRKEYSAAFRAALEGEGAHIQMVRFDTVISMYVELDGEWVLLQTAPCTTDDKTEIAFYVLSGNWTVKEVSFSAMEYVSAEASTSEKEGNLAHYTWQIPASFDYENKEVYYFDEDGTRTTLEAVTLKKLLTNVTLNITGQKVDETAALSGELTGTSDIGIVISGTVTNGSLTLTNVNVLNYTVTLGDYVGVLALKEDTTEYDLVLIYKWATNATDTSTGDTAEVDLSELNESHTITMCERYGAPDIWTGVTGTTNWAEATITLPDAVKNSKSVTVEFTLKLNADATIHALTRFGVMMAEEKGIFAAVMGSNSMQVCPINPDNPLGIFDGWSGDHNGYADAVIAALQGDGLQVRMVRDGTEISMYLYLNGAWTFMASTTCGADAVTDIRLVVGGNNTNVWEFSSIEYFVNEMVSEVPEAEEALPAEEK